MSSNNNNNNNKTENKKDTFWRNPFRMDIEDEIYDPFKYHDDIFGFDLEKNFFNHFTNMFTDFGLLSENKKEEKPEKVEKVEEKPEKVEKVEEKEEKIEKPKEVVPVEEEKEDEINTDSKKVEPEKVEDINTDTKKVEEINTDTKKVEEINTDTKKVEEKDEKTEKTEKKDNSGSFYSKVYYSSYNNLNGKPNQETYHSETIKQTNDGHNISETKEAYKNSNGVVKSAYQRDLDGKTTRFIKEKDLKTGKNNQKKIVKGIEEKGINDFNKEYNEYSKKCGFKKNFHRLNTFNPFYPIFFNDFNRKQISDGNSNILLHRLLF